MADIPEFIVSKDGTHALCTTGRFENWIMYKHPGGQWISLRKATDREIEAAYHAAGFWIVR